MLLIRGFKLVWTVILVPLKKNIESNDLKRSKYAMNYLFYIYLYFDNNIFIKKNMS